MYVHLNYVVHSIKLKQLRRLPVKVASYVHQQEIMHKALLSRVPI